MILAVVKRSVVLNEAFLTQNEQGGERGKKRGREGDMRGKRKRARDIWGNSERGKKRKNRMCRKYFLDVVRHSLLSTLKNRRVLFCSEEFQEQFSDPRARPNVYLSD